MTQPERAAQLTNRLGVFPDKTGSHLFLPAKPLSLNSELNGFCGIQVRPDTDKPDTFYRKKDVLSVCPVRPPLRPAGQIADMSENVRNVRMSGR
jgi:hypothetical protein